MTFDPSQPQTAPERHTYTLKPWVHLLNLISLLLLGSIIGVPTVGIIQMTASFNQAGAEYGPLPVVLLCTVAPLIVLCGVILLQLLVNFISGFFTYIKTTPEGIENRSWPYRHIRSSWSEVERLGKVFLYDVVYLKSFAVVGLSTSLAWPWKLFNFTQFSIVLSSYNGWPAGQLEKDLKQYAPRLFENPPAAEQGQTPGEGPAALEVNQEQRLLAALVHASILVSGIGVFVPLAIYLSQKKKSSFLAFQALQAFVFQMVGGLLTLILPLCLVGLIAAAAFGTSLTENANTSTAFLAAMLVGVIIAVLMVVGSLAYGIYGTVAAILAYQGKNFRYAVIGRQIEKRFYPGSPDHS